jgi:hypothetical protein
VVPWRNGSVLRESFLCVCVGTSFDMSQRSLEGEHLDVDVCVHVEYWRCSPGTKPLAHAGTSMGQDRPPMNQQFFLIKTLLSRP